MSWSTIGIAATLGLLAIDASGSGASALSESSLCQAKTISGEVVAGKSFEAPVAEGLSFRLAAVTDPATPGWTIEVRGGAGGDVDFVPMATPPYRFWNPRYLSLSYGMSAAAVVAMSPREFRFVTSEADQARAAGAVGKLLWSADVPEVELVAAKATLDGLVTGEGRFTIVDSRLEPREDGKGERIAWLRFSAELCVPPKRGITDVRGVLPRDALGASRQYRELPDDCPPEKPPDVSLVRYGDLDGDGRDEMAVTGYSCLSGTGGPDLLAVFRLVEGEVEEIDVGELPDRFEGRDVRSGLRGHMGIEIEGDRLLLLFPVYREGDANCCASGGRRSLAYRYERGRLVFVESRDFPPEE